MLPSVLQHRAGKHHVEPWDEVDDQEARGDAPVSQFIERAASKKEEEERAERDGHAGHRGDRYES
jgi:hypothetical protein